MLEDLAVCLGNEIRFLLGSLSVIRGIEKYILRYRSRGHGIPSPEVRKDTANHAIAISNMAKVVRAKNDMTLRGIENAKI